jgi:hypothetical protein
VKRIVIKARRPSFGTVFRFCLLSAFGAVFFTLLVALPVAKIDPQLTPPKLIIGVILMLTVWPLAVAIWFSIGGWLVFNIAGRKCPFQFTFVCDDDAVSIDISGNAPNQAAEPTRTAVTPPADAGDRASGARGSP